MPTENPTYLNRAVQRVLDRRNVREQEDRILSPVAAVRDDLEAAEQEIREDERQKVEVALLRPEAIDEARIGAGFRNRFDSVERPTFRQMEGGIKAALHIALNASPETQEGERRPFDAGVFDAPDGVELEDDEGIRGGGWWRRDGDRWYPIAAPQEDDSGQGEDDRLQAVIAEAERFGGESEDWLDANEVHSYDGYRHLGRQEVARSIIDLLTLLAPGGDDR
jgi:hypothetical protein